MCGSGSLYPFFLLLYMLSLTDNPSSESVWSDFSSCFLSIQRKCLLHSIAKRLWANRQKSILLVVAQILFCSTPYALQRPMTGSWGIVVWSFVAVGHQLFFCFIRRNISAATSTIVSCRRGCICLCSHAHWLYSIFYAVD